MGSAIAGTANAPAAAPKDTLEAVNSASGLIVEKQTFVPTNDRVIDNRKEVAVKPDDRDV